MHLGCIGCSSGFRVAINITKVRRMNVSAIEIEVNQHDVT